MSHSSTDPSVHEQACLWATRIHAGNCSSADRHALQEWLNQSEEHRLAYSAIVSLWQELADLGGIAGPQLAAARNYLRSNTRRRTPARRLALAACLSVAALAAPGTWTLLSTQTYRTATGEHRDYSLADGSHIELNTDSEVRVRYTVFSRTVTLDRGEALFTVVHDEGRPFEVRAANGRIRDIGTRFDVYRQTDNVSVTVLDGEVEVSTQTGKARRSLTRGYKLSYDAGGKLTPESPINAEEAVAWRENRLVFKDESLGHVLEQLGRYHDTTLSTPDTRLQALKVSGTFPTNDLKLALDAMANALPIRITRLGDHRILLENKAAGHAR